MRARSPRRVVVTGLGCMTPLGDDVETTFSGAVEGRSGVREITRFDVSQQAVRFAGLASDEPKIRGVSAKEIRRMDRFVRLALVAARQAMDDSALEVDDANRDRIGVAIGSGIGGLLTLEESYRSLFDRGPRRLTPFVIPMVISNMASGHVSILYGLRGPNLCHVSACTTGVHAIGEAARMIAWGDADVMLAGGAEAPVSALGVGGFAAMRALSTRNEEPQRASRPFDLDRDGFVLGEGAGVLLLEALDSARARGARIRAELMGYGVSPHAWARALRSRRGPWWRRHLHPAICVATGNTVVEINIFLCERRQPVHLVTHYIHNPVFRAERQPHLPSNDLRLHLRAEAPATLAAHGILLRWALC